MGRGRENNPTTTTTTVTPAVTSTTTTTRASRFETVRPTTFSIFSAVNSPDNHLLLSTPETFNSLDNSLLQSTPESSLVRSKPSTFRPNPRFLVEPEVRNTVEFQEQATDREPEQRFQFFLARTAEQTEDNEELIQSQDQLIQEQQQLVLFPEESAIHHAELTWNQDPFRYIFHGCLTFNF